jgi:uncharacterized membrane protein
MSELIVVGFHGKHRAAEVLDELVQLSTEYVIVLQDAVAAYRRDNGTLRIDQSLNPTEREGAGVGGLFGLLVGGLLAAPFTAGASAAAAAAAVGVSAAAGGTIGAVAGGDDAIDWKERFGISDEFVRQVGGMIQPGDSAVFALIRTADPALVAEQFRGYGGKVLRTTLPPWRESRLQQTLRG